MCVCIHTHREHIHISVATSSRYFTSVYWQLILASLVRDSGLWTGRGAEVIPDVRKVRRDIVGRAIGCCLSLPRLHDTTRDSHNGGLSIKTNYTVCAAAV